MQQLPGPPTYRMFNSSAAAEAYYVDSKDTTKENIVAGVVFSYSNDPNAYAIRIKPGSLPGTTDFYNFDKGKREKEILQFFFFVFVFALVFFFYVFSNEI